MTVTWDRLQLLTFRESRTHARRSIVTICVIAAAAALLVAVTGIYGSLTGSVDRVTAGVAGDADFEVAGITDTGFDQSLTAGISAVPGVAAAVPLLWQAQGSGSSKYLLFGITSEITAVRSDLQAKAGAAPAAVLSVPDGIAVGSGMGWSRGQRVQVGTSTVTVAAVLDTDLNGGRFVVAPLPLAQRLTDRVGRIDSVLVVAKRDTDRANVRAAVESAIGGRAVVANPGFQGQQARQSFALIQSTLLTFAGVAFVVAAFLVFNTMSMTVTRRRPQISMLRALGGRRRNVAMDLLVEAAATGLAGALVGAPIGVLAGRWALGGLPPLITEQVDARIVYQMPSYAVPLAILACMGTAAIAAVVAARQAYRVSPIEALAPVEVSSLDRMNPSLRIAAAVVGIVLLAVAVFLALRGEGLVAASAVPFVFLASVPLCVALKEVIVSSAARVAVLFGQAGRLGSASVQRSPRRVWAASVTVAIAISLVVALTGLNNNLIDSATRSFAPVARIDLGVSTTPPDQLPAGPILPADTGQRLTEIDGVARVVPNLWVWATMRDRRVMLQGVASGTNSLITSAMSEHDRMLLFDGQGVALSRDLGRSWRVDAGDTLELPTPTGAKRVRVLAVVDVLSSGVSTIAISLPYVQQWYDRPGVNNYELGLAPGTDRAVVADAVRHAVPTSVFVVTGKQAVEAGAGAIKQMAAVFAGVQWIIAIVAAVALLNTLMLSVLERGREIGVLRAIGSSRKSAVRMVLAEAAAIGMAGAVVGTVVGLIAHYLGTRAFESIATIPVTYTLTPWIIVYAAGALALCLLGAIPPARYAGRMNIAQAIALD
ncbi:FtsX-like permease family protein [Nocardia nepalensis]|uniref:FtsX-like permease family protein n=1 Tax=Nocardia nepalensis TaxID=3375448 RepID=UPI003B66EF21